MVLNAIATSLVRVDLALPQRAVILAALVLVAAAASPALARAATGAFLRRFS